ncbi:MAG TPA: hypothetical protein VM940_17115 [Chthoniobacterales bacterium]|nr:hypothetical protein [Chthoniobacterales bacterium]
MKKSITLQLTQTKWDKNCDHDTLGQLLEKAVEVLTPPDALTLCPKGRNGQRWLSRWAIRAFCEEIIRTGNMFCPPEISFTKFWCKRAKGFRFQASRN